MRRLHPVGRHEVPVDQGAIRLPDGELETWTVHALPEGRHVVRVEASGALWHLALGADALPERLQARWREGARDVEATVTFFDDEALIWRRGAEPASEVVALPSGCRLLWPPVAGRDWCLAGIAAGGPEAVAVVRLDRVEAARGSVVARSDAFSAAREGDVLTLTAPGRPEARMALDASGRLLAWRDGDILSERLSGDAR